MNKYKELLATPMLERDTDSYEKVYDDFIKFAGGARVDDIFDIPDEKENADYFISLSDCEIILELKQVRKYEKYNSVDEYFNKELKKGTLKKFKILENNKIRISPDSLPKSEWNKFYKRFRPSISNDLNKAARQLKDTETFIPLTNKNRYKGVMLINSNDYNLSIDIMSRLIES